MRAYLQVLVGFVAFTCTANEIMAFDSFTNLGPMEIVQANGKDIQVPGSSVPSFLDFNGDGLKDLIIGQGSEPEPPGKVRIYPNIGTKRRPEFGDFFFVRNFDEQQSGFVSLELPADSYFGCFPRAVYWDDDTKRDLLIGLADGTVKVYLRLGSQEEYEFDSGEYVMAGTERLKTRARSTPFLVDWNNDGGRDLVVGSVFGKFHLYMNCCGGNFPPVFVKTAAPTGDGYAQAAAGDLFVPDFRSSPHVGDFNGDNRKDILSGNGEGQLLLFRNIGSDDNPIFAEGIPLESDGVPIDVGEGSVRSWPFVCDWTGDGRFDILVGSADGKVLLYQSRNQSGDLDYDFDVDLTDLTLLAGRWQSSCPDCTEDFTGDDYIDCRDLAHIAAHWLDSIPH